MPDVASLVELYPCALLGRFNIPLMGRVVRAGLGGILLWFTRNPILDNMQPRPRCAVVRHVSDTTDAVKTRDAERETFLVGFPQFRDTFLVLVRERDAPW